MGLWPSPANAHTAGKDLHILRLAAVRRATGADFPGPLNDGHSGEDFY